MGDDHLSARRQQHRWEIGERLRTIRRAAGLSQLALERLSGVDNKTISRVENGQRNVGVDDLGRLADALDVPLWRLFRDEET